jgi:hypothetical protein
MVADGDTHVRLVCGDAHQAWDDEDVDDAQPNGSRRPSEVLVSLGMHFWARVSVAVGWPAMVRSLAAGSRDVLA